MNVVACIPSLVSAVAILAQVPVEEQPNSVIAQAIGHWNLTVEQKPLAFGICCCGASSSAKRVIVSIVGLSSVRLDSGILTLLLLLLRGPPQRIQSHRGKGGFTRLGPLYRGTRGFLKPFWLKFQ